MEKRYPDTSDWDKLISPITPKMKKGTWEIFKTLIPRGKKLNDALVGLIENYIHDNSEEATDEEVKKWMKDQDYWKKKKSKVKKQ